MFSFLKKLFKGFDPDLTESEENASTDAAESGAVDVDSLWEAVTAKLAKDVKIHINTPKGRRYILIASTPNKGNLTYICVYGVRTKSLSVGIETYAGEEARDAIQAMIDKAPKKFILKDVEAKQGATNKSKWAWGVGMSAETSIDELATWCAEAVIELYKYFEAQEPMVLSGAGKADDASESKPAPKAKDDESQRLAEDAAKAVAEAKAAAEKAMAEAQAAAEKAKADAAAAQKAAEAELKKLREEAEKAKAKAEKEAAKAKAEAEAAIKAAAEEAKRAAETKVVSSSSAISYIDSRSFNVVLVSANAVKLGVVKAVKEFTGISLNEAKEIVDMAPVVVKRNVSKTEAETLKTALEEAGAEVKIDSLEGTLPGIFTLKDGKKIRFSQGNLQFNPKKYEFRFAKEQYETLGKEANEKCDPNYDGWIDIFGWGTSGYMGCQPTESDLNLRDYGPASGHLTGDNANYDWGVYNPITNGGNKEGLWRTPTKDELNYILSERPNALKLKLRCTVCGVEGVIIMPDDFWSNRLRFPIEISSNNPRDNQFDKDQWEFLESVGVVFIPISTLWWCSKSWKIDDAIHIWTSDRNTYAINFNDGESCKFIVYTYEVISKRPVRLVKDVK